MNHSSLRTTVLAAKELGLDGISFLAADLTSEAFNRPLLWPIEKQNEVGLSIEEVSALEDELEALIATFHDDLRNGYIAESAAKLRRIAKHFRAHLGLASATSPRCNAPWVSAVIETNGAVRPCFFHQPIGNLQDGALEEIINGEAAQAFRRRLDVASNPVCRNCVCSLYHASLTPGRVDGRTSRIIQVTEVTMDKILVIDNDSATRRVLRQMFVSSEFRWRGGRRDTAISLFDAIMPRVVIVEPRIPGFAGRDFCSEIRRRSANVPILVLSAAKAEVDKVVLLELGADDYVTKPFSPRELLARVRPPCAV